MFSAVYSNQTGPTTFLNNVTENGSTPLTESYYEASLYWAGKSAKWGKAASLTPKFDSEAFTSGTDTYVSLRLRQMDVTTQAIQLLLLMVNPMEIQLQTQVYLAILHLIHRV